MLLGIYEILCIYSGMIMSVRQLRLNGELIGASSALVCYDQGDLSFSIIAV